MKTYKETVLRFRLMRHDELPEGHKAEMRKHGIDPDNSWMLIASFENEDDAMNAMFCEQEVAASFQKFKVVDAGEATVIERALW